MSHAGIEITPMKLSMTYAAAAGLSSPSQIARRVTEQWGEDNLYCAACASNRLRRTPCNTKACDFSCPACSARYELKAGKAWSERRIPDAGYDSMIRSIRADTAPNLLVLQYTPAWAAHNLLLVPRFFFTEAAIEKRKPLAANARRAGWVGCNILLSAIAPEGKIRLISDGRVEPSSAVRSHYLSLAPLSSIDTPSRGWTLDLLRIVRDLRQPRFTLAEIYAYEKEFAKLHPGNRHVRAKLRQQLQVLRDLGVVRFLGKGSYQVVSSTNE